MGLIFFLIPLIKMGVIFSRFGKRRGAFVVAAIVMAVLVPVIIITTLYLTGVLGKMPKAFAKQLAGKFKLYKRCGEDDQQLCVLEGIKFMSGAGAAGDGNLDLEEAKIVCKGMGKICKGVGCDGGGPDWCHPITMDLDKLSLWTSESGKKNMGNVYEHV